MPGAIQAQVYGYTGKNCWPKALGSVVIHVCVHYTIFIDFYFCLSPTQFTYRTAVAARASKFA